MRHRFHIKLDPKTTQCSRCGVIRETGKNRSFSYKTRPQAPWQSEEPECRDPSQPTLFEARPDDEYQPPPPHVPLHVSGQERGSPRQDAESARLDLAVRVAVHRYADRNLLPDGGETDHQSGGVSSPEDALALARSVFGEGVTIVTRPPVDFGGYWIHLEMEPEERFRVTNTYDGQPLGFDVHIVRTRTAALRYAEAFSRNARKWLGASLRLLDDKGETVQEWICDGRKYRPCETFMKQE